MSTGTIYLRRLRQASIATEAILQAFFFGKAQPEPESGLFGSCGPKRAAAGGRSVLVGRTVDGPPRWMSNMTSGTLPRDRKAQRFVSGHAGPDVVVGGGMANAPAYAADDQDEVLPAISLRPEMSSTPKSLLMVKLVKKVRSRSK